MSYRYEIRLSGEGGQGIVLAGVILAEAAAIYDDQNATQTQVYGPESRGGASKAEVIISDEEEIDYPKAISVDLLLALTQAAADKYGHDLKTRLLSTSDHRPRPPECIHSRLAKNPHRTRRDKNWQPGRDTCRCDQPF